MDPNEALAMPAGQRIGGIINRPVRDGIDSCCEATFIDGFSSTGYRTGTAGWIDSFPVDCRPVPSTLDSGGDGPWGHQGDDP